MNKLGVAAEQMAATYLQQQGLTLISQNFTCRYGEIDLIMREGRMLVFVEVRLRSNARFGGAGMSITPAKQHKLQRSAEYYLQQYGNSACRFDAVLMNKASAEHIEWIKNAFDS
ncbi:MAG: YraN family protein [Methylophilaceae bacterium]|nr:YraN family protein [Methylophilaceae bacterium]